MKIILASASPRRKELLKLMGINKFEVIVSNKEEKLQNNLSIEEQVEKLAMQKAKNVLEQTKGADRIIIGADTIVVKNGKIYGKPKSREEAKEMLKELRGKKHQVITGLCVIVEKQGKREQYLTHDTSNIWIKNMEEKEIDQWLNQNTYQDKAGAYAIQEEFGKYIEKIEGNYFGIVGLPIHLLYDILKKYE